MNIFLSAPSRDLKLVEVIQSKIIEAGHEVYDWVSSYKEEPNKQDDEIVANFIRGLNSVKNCDLFILVVTSNAGPSVGCGTELGVAMEHAKQSKLLELIPIDDSSPWYYHPGRMWFTGRAYTKTCFTSYSKLIDSLKYTQPFPLPK
jgi:hypothetical protein